MSKAITVALVDDHTMFRDAMRLVLTDRGFDLVAEAGDARSCFTLIDEKRPDVVLLDLRLPGMDGVTAVRELHSRAPQSKVMILSAFSAQHEVDEAWAAGVHGYMTKNQDIDTLVDGIRTVAAGDRYMAPGLQVSGEPRPGALAPLSARERDVFRLLVRGMTTREIAAELCISGKTVDTHRERILKKLDLHSVVQLVRYAAQHDILDV